VHSGPYADREISSPGLIGNNLYHCVIGSRILGGYALKDGMPLWRYISNRFLTFIENLLLGVKLSEFHTGYRAFSRDLLENLTIDANSDDFVFDNQMLTQILWANYRIGEISCPTKYFKEASSINFLRSVKYGFGCLAVAFQYRLSKYRIISSSLFTNIETGHKKDMILKNAVANRPGGGNDPISDVQHHKSSA